MKRILLILGILFLSKMVNAQYEEVFETKIFDEELKTFLLYPSGLANAFPGIKPSILSLNTGETMILEFDDLRASYRQFHIRIQHCDINWVASSLSDLEYLREYNDFIINDFQVSQNTKVPFYHYGYRLPEIKLSGNYVLLVYENSISNYPVAQIRFRVLSSKIGISANASTAQDPSIWKTHQQVNFEIAYGNYSVRNPRTEFKVLIRQNYRDDTIKKDFFPSSINGSKRTLSYRFFKNENVFPAGNEYRLVELTSTFRTGSNIEEIKLAYENQVWLVPQRTRANKTYLESADLNGRYIIETIDGGHPSISADYLHVNLGLKSLVIEPNKKVCFLGGFNYYDCDNGEMHYNQEFGGYVLSTLLKQGNYDFQFALMNEEGQLDFSFFEGNFSDSGNSYEIFVYHKPPSSKYDLLIGYGLILNSK